MKETTHLKLKKPDLTDYVNVEDLNENMDVLDTSINSINASVASFSESIKIIEGVELVVSGWSNVGNRAVFTYTNPQIDESTVVNIAIHLDSVRDASALIGVTQSFVGYALVYAREVPKVKIMCDVTLIKEGG